jgi:hypothetical protein
MAKRTNLDELVETLRQCGWHSLKERDAIAEARSTLERLQDVQKELEKEEPDVEHIADLLLPIFVR